MLYNLQKLRKKHGYTQRDMANLLGLKTISAYCKKERGYCSFSVEEAKKISDYLGLSIDEIFFEDKLS